MRPQRVKKFSVSFETPERNRLVGYLRLRVPSPAEFRQELLPAPVPIIREIRIVGELVPTFAKPTSVQIQHRGFGTQLLNSAEIIARDEYDAQKIAVIAGIGVREYFYKKGYVVDGPYVSKFLSQ